jgi:serine protease Do
VSTATTVTDVSDIVNNVMPAIVQVTNMSVTEYRSIFGSYEKPSESAGSGIIVSQDANYIYVATNNHVVVNSQSLTVTFCDDNAVSAEVVGTDAETDLAVIKVKVSDIDSSTINKIKVATLGSSDNLSVGESAIVIGNALGYGQSVTTGVISATNREVTLQNEESGGKYTNKLIQTDAAVNPGNSGGALLNMNGEVVGIISAKYSDTSVEGMGYAIPISSASSIIQKIMNGETIDHSKDASGSSESTAYLGIYGFDVSSENAMRYEMPQGVYVSEAIKGQAADKAGIVKGDIITGIKGVSITSMSEMKNLISKQKVGDKIKIKVAVRSNNYAEKEIEVTLGDSKNAPKTEERDSDSDSSSSSNSLEDYIKQFFNGGR